MMNPATARTLREYSAIALPGPVKRKFPGMQADLYRFLKRWWNEKMSHRERARFRRIALVNGPLPDDIKQEARQSGLIVEWPPKPLPKVKRKPKGKPKSRRLKHYRRR